MAFTKINPTNISDYAIGSQQLSNTAVAAFAQALEPKVLYANVASNTYTVLDDTAVNVGGGFIVVTGAEFQTGATILIDTTPATSVTYVNSTTLGAQVPAKSAATYNLYVVNPDGGTGIKISGITYSGTPTWVTTSPLANITSNTVFTGNVSATGATTYSNTSILPTGFTLLANGYYYGNVSVGVDTTYNFTLRATDAELQDSDKTFSLTTTLLPPTYTINYLMVAGGGAGGAGDSGGGGAGGMLTGTFTAFTGTPYTLTVGAGGTVSAPGVTSGSGSLSRIASPSAPFTTITSTGGGVGGGYNWAGQPGGSGGGGSNAMPNSLGTAVGSPGSYGAAGPQGYPGGGGPGNGGGGGGAGGAGLPATPNSSNYGSAQAGGAGALWPFTNTYYAGGGGNGNGGAGGAGGGGAGSGAPNGYVGTPGSANTGGGGGAHYFSGYAGDPTKVGAGGSGVIILAIPTPNYPGSAPGATVTTPPAAPGKTVVTFTSSGTFTA
jgi:hypothetical protein